MRNLIIAGACLGALAAPAAAQTLDPTTILNVVRGIYEATRGVNNYNNVPYNNGQQPLPQPYNNGYPPQYPTTPNNGYNPGYNNPGYNNPGYNNPGYTTPGYNNPGSYNSLNSPLDVIFTSLSEGSTVPSNFTLTGQTSPYNQIELFVQPRGGQRLRSNTSADASGRFAINVDASQVPYNGILAIQAQARDSQGNLGPARNVQVTRR